uniref:Uncharacterized protein n=1 Tax=Triticum urartu TaxID=4572 RepID=A0A8R7TSF3_TRIUA
MKPCILMRLETREVRLRTPTSASFSPAVRLYWEMRPQTAMRPCTFMLSSTASSILPPTFSK